MAEASLAFVVQIWQDRAAVGEPPRWHGRVDDVDGQSGMSFDTLLALCVYLGERSGMAGGNQAPKGQGAPARQSAARLPAGRDSRRGANPGDTDTEAP